MYLEIAIAKFGKSLSAYTAGSAGMRIILVLAADYCYIAKFGLIFAYGFEKCDSLSAAGYSEGCVFNIATGVNRAILA